MLCYVFTGNATQTDAYAINDEIVTLGCSEQCRLYDGTGATVDAPI